MIELIRAAALAGPSQPAIITPTRTLTWAQLAARAEAAATAMQARGVERLAVLDADPADVWALLAAGSLAGVETCVYPVAATDDVVGQLRSRLDHAVLVTSRESLTYGVLRPAALLDSGARLTDEIPAGPRPLLILTSGTSGEPKAAQHDWARILRAVTRIVPTPDHRWLLAYALNQFGGLQILLHVAAARATLVAGASFQPRDGLAAMTAHSVTHASGTPTFWRFLLAETHGAADALPDLRQVTLSGEAVPSALLSQVIAAFPRAHVSQIYAATETGQGVTVRDGRSGLPLSVLDEGGDVVFRVDAGELYVRSASSMLGYYGQDALPDNGWRATGDLVEIVDDRILFRGRTSEVINVGGVKVHPVPIEECVSAVDGVVLVRAFGRPSKMVGNIVALEVVPAPDADEEELRTAIRAACAHLPPASRPRSIAFVATMETGGNKLARRSSP